MDHEKNYQTALELASTSRYREARQKLESILDELPDNVEALILLGKVEYYLRLFSCSRRRFETALIYEPGNMAAYFGLQYFKERRKKQGFVAALVSSLLLLIFSGAVLYFAFSSSLEAGFLNLENGFARRADSFESSLAESKNTIRAEIQQLAEQLEQFTSNLETSQAENLSKIGRVDARILELRAAYNKLSRDLKQITAMLDSYLLQEQQEK